MATLPPFWLGGVVVVMATLRGGAAGGGVVPSFSRACDVIFIFFIPPVRRAARSPRLHGRVLARGRASCPSERTDPHAGVLRRGTVPGMLAACMTLPLSLLSCFVLPNAVSHNHVRLNIQGEKAPSRGHSPDKKKKKAKEIHL